MDPVRNPYTPGAGFPPPELAGRANLLSEAGIALARISQGKNAKCQILTGLRGVGKTVLLRKIQEEARALGYQATIVEVGEGQELHEVLVPALRKVLITLSASEKAKRAMRVLKSFAAGLKFTVGEFSVGVTPEEGSADSGNLESDLGALFEAVGEAAADSQSAVALCLDEIQYLSEREFGALIMALHRVAQQQLPLVLFGAGLPQVVGLAGRSKTYAERLFTFPEVGPLNEAEAEEAIQGPARKEGVSFTDDAIWEIIRITEGYPFFLQTWAYAAWNAAPAGEVIDLDAVQRATTQVVHELDKDFFKVRFERMTPWERRYALAMAMGGPGPQRSGEVARRMGEVVASVAPARNNLIHKGMIYSSSHGENAFTTPLFDQYMLRVMAGQSPKSTKAKK